MVVGSDGTRNQDYCAGEGQQQFHQGTDRPVCKKKGVSPEGSQSRQTVKYGYESRRTREPRINVLARASSNLAVSQSIVKGLTPIISQMDEFTSPQCVPSGSISELYFYLLLYVPSGLIPVRFWGILYALLIFHMRVIYPTHLLLLDSITLIIFGENKDYETPQFSPFSSYAHALT
jgi:hypothetical protein